MYCNVSITYEVFVIFGMHIPISQVTPGGLFVYISWLNNFSREAGLSFGFVNFNHQVL